MLMHVCLLFPPDFGTWASLQIQIYHIFFLHFRSVLNEYYPVITSYVCVCVCSETAVLRVPLSINIQWLRFECGMVEDNWRCETNENFNSSKRTHTRLYDIAQCCSYKQNLEKCYRSEPVDQ